MPSTCRQRALTDQERQWLRDFKEKPNGFIWALRAAALSLIAATCCGGMLQALFREVLRSTSSRLMTVAIAAISIGGLIWQKFVRDERRDRRERRKHRLLAAESGVVEVTEIVFDRMWSISGHPDQGSHVVLEVRPFVLWTISVPADEDEHERALQSLHSSHQPLPQINGTFPRRRLVLELVRVPDGKPRDMDSAASVASAFLLSMTWLDERMESSGEVPYQNVSYLETTYLVGGLYSLAREVPLLVRGPWMTPPTTGPSKSGDGT